MSSRSSLKHSSSRGGSVVRQGSQTPAPPPAPAKPPNRVPLRGGGGVSKSKSAPALQDEAVDNLDDNSGERTLEAEQQGNEGSPEGSRRPVRSLRGDRALPRPRSPKPPAEKGAAPTAAVAGPASATSHGPRHAAGSGSHAGSGGKDAPAASEQQEPQSLERTVLDFGFPSAADPREWLMENSERLLAQTEKCLVVHRQLQRLLLAGETVDGRDNGDIKRELGNHGSQEAGGRAGYLSRRPAAAHAQQQATAAVEVLTAEMVGATRQSAAVAMKGRRGTEVLGHRVELAALKRRRAELRSELSYTTEEAFQLQSQISSARSASDKFQEAVTSCCEAELARLNNHARDLEARIAERLEFLKFSEQASKDAAKGSCNLPPGGRPTSASSSGTPRRTASGGTLVARGPAPLVAGVRGPLSPPRRSGGGEASQPHHASKAPAPQGASSPRSAIQATVGTAVPSTTPRRPNGVATPPAGAPTNRRVYGRSSGSSSQLGGALASSAERHRFTASPGTVVSQHALQLRTPPRSKQAPASTERSAERPGSLALERSTERSSSEGCSARLEGSRGRLGGSSTLAVNRTRQGSNHSSPRPGSPKPNHGLIRTALPPQLPGVIGEVQRQASSPRSPSVLQPGTIQAAAAVAAAASVSMHQAPGVTMASTARTAVATRSAVASSAAASAASAAARAASPSSVLQSLQHLETVRCQVQADFWSQ